MKDQLNFIPVAQDCRDKEDEKALKRLNKWLTWLKSIKDRVQPQVEWGEEDERLFQIVIDVLDKQNHLGNISRTDLIACVRKLKSLRPQKQWKPTEDQMKQLGWIAEQNRNNMIGKGLMTLYNDLNKLRNE